MADPKPHHVSARSGGALPVQKPRWAFFKGLLTGAAIEIPLVAAHGVGCWPGSASAIPTSRFMRIMRLTTVFAGVAALFTAGGIGRLAAYASVDGGRRARDARSPRARTPSRAPGS